MSELQLSWTLDVLLDLLGNIARALDMVDPKSTEATGDFKPWAMVYRLLDDAATATSQSKSLVNSKMEIAARLMENVIAVQGNKFSIDAFNQSSGRIPKNLRPVLLNRFDLRSVRATSREADMPSSTLGAARTWRVEPEHLESTAGDARWIAVVTVGSNSHRKVPERAYVCQFWFMRLLWNAVPISNKDGCRSRDSV